VEGVAKVRRELGPVWQETLGAPMSRSEAIRWLVQAGLWSFEASLEAQEERERHETCKSCKFAAPCYGLTGRVGSHSPWFNSALRRHLDVEADAVAHFAGGGSQGRG